MTDREVALARATIENEFPKLAKDPNSYHLTSPMTRRYNCIAWAADDTSKKWQWLSFPEPGYYWPFDESDGDQDHIDALVAVYVKLHGYQICSDMSFEVGYEKLALYCFDDDVDCWSHTARQLCREWWTSKLGHGHDIIHRTPDLLTGPAYGQVRVYLRRPFVGLTERAKTELFDDWKHVCDRRDEPEPKGFFNRLSQHALVKSLLAFFSRRKRT